MGLATKTSFEARPLCALLLAFGQSGHDLGQQVSHDLAAGQNVRHWLLTADGETVVYSVTAGAMGGQWFRASADGSQDVLALTDALPLDRTLSRGQISSDGNWLAYTCDRDVVGQVEIYGVPTDGSKAVVQLNPPLAPYPPGGFLNGFHVTPDSKRVLYAARQDSADVSEIFSTELGDPLPYPGDSSRLRPGRPIR